MGNGKIHFNNFIDCKGILIVASATKLLPACPSGNTFLVWKIYG